MADQKVKEMEPVETQIVEIMPPDIENLIYVVRNKQVMVDSDLAMLYQVETKALNRAVKRNIKRFPEDFCFQLTTEETESLKCQSGTSKIQEPEKKGYHVGASLKDAGKKCFGINLIEDAGIVRDILQRVELETEE